MSLVNDSADNYEIRPAPAAAPGIIFFPVPEPRATKNRLHLDFRPDDQLAEVDRLT